jgi:hypothetical protein
MATDATLVETHVQRQEEEVSSRDKSAISPDTDAVPMRRWRTDSIIEEASQYHPDRARSLNFHLLITIGAHAEPFDDRSRHDALAIAGGGGA